MRSVTELHRSDFAAAEARDLERFPDLYHPDAVQLGLNA